jgi:hypothetical protein
MTRFPVLLSRLSARVCHSQPCIGHNGSAHALRIGVLLTDQYL